MSEYRVKLDLTAFYTDYRRQSYILIKREWSSVKDLQEHVEKTFDIRKVEFLTSDEVYLPPFESIDIINLSDEIRAIAGYDITLPSQLKKKKIKKIKSDAEEVDSNGNDEKQAAVEDAESDLKSKRKRKRKRKSKEGKDEINETSTPYLKLPKKLPRKTDETKGTGAAHIHFDDEGNALDSNPFQMSFVNYIDAQDNMKARIVRATVRIIGGEQIIGAAKNDKNCISVVKELFAV